MNLAGKIKRILKKAPAELWVEKDGELLPTLDLYLFLANELGVEYSVRISPLGDKWHAVASLRHDDRVISADAIIDDREDDAGEELDPTRMSQLQSRALIKLFRLYFYPYIRATLPNAKNILLATAQILYRERGYARAERLEHARQLLGLDDLESFNALTAEMLAEIIVSLTIDNPTSQYADDKEDSNEQH